MYITYIVVLLYHYNLYIYILNAVIGVASALQSGLEQCGGKGGWIRNIV